MTVRGTQVRRSDQADVGLPTEKHPQADGKYGRSHRGQRKFLLRTRQPDGIQHETGVGSSGPLRQF
jgi:hypothetical protein